MPQAAKNSQEADKGERVVVSIPAELTKLIDAKITADGGEALENLGVEVATLRSGYVHKLLKDALSE